MKKPTRKEAKKEFMNASSKSHEFAPHSIQHPNKKLKSPQTKAEKKEYKKYKKEYIKER